VAWEEGARRVRDEVGKRGGRVSRKRERVEGGREGGLRVVGDGMGMGQERGRAVKGRGDERGKGGKWGRRPDEDGQMEREAFWEL